MFRVFSDEVNKVLPLLPQEDHMQITAIKHPLADKERSRNLLVHISKLVKSMTT